MKRGEDSGVTGRLGHRGERLSPGQSVAEWVQQRPYRSSLGGRLSVEAVSAEAEA